MNPGTGARTMSASDWLLVAIGVLLVWQMDQLRGFSVADLLIAILLFVRTVTLSLSVRALSVWHCLVLGLLGVHCLAMSGTVPWRADWAIVNKFLGFGWLLVFYVVIAGSVRSVEQVTAVLRRVLVGSLVLGVLLLGAGMAGVSVLGEQSLTAGGRLEGLSSNSGPYATYLSALMLVALALLLSNIRIVRRGFVDVVIFASFIPLIVLTGSRSGYLAAAAGLVFLLIRRRNGPSATSGVVGRLLLLAVPVVWVLIQVGVQVQYRNPFERSFTIDERMVANSTALHLWLDNPVFGAGLGTFMTQYGAYIHNTGLWLLAEFGVVGFALAAAMFVWMFRRTGFGAPGGPPALGALRRGLSAGLIAYLAASVSVELSYQRGLWFLAALGVGLYQVVNSGLPGRADRWRQDPPRVRIGWPTPRPGA